MLHHPDVLVQMYRQYVDTLCIRSFDEHREMPCNVLKEAILNDSKPKCKGCSYEQAASDTGTDR